MRKIFVLVLFLAVLKPLGASSDKFITEQQIILSTHLYRQREQDKEIRKRIAIIKAIEWVESRHNTYAHNKGEDARGVLQIRSIMVKEVNQLGHLYTHQDAWDYNKSISMFTKYQNKFNPTWDAELAAKKWNGGREGEKKLSTQEYWERVEVKFNELFSNEV